VALCALSRKSGATFSRYRVGVLAQAAPTAGDRGIGSRRHVVHFRAAPQRHHGSTHFCRRHRGDRVSYFRGFLWADKLDLWLSLDLVSGHANCAVLALRTLAAWAKILTPVTILLAGAPGGWRLGGRAKCGDYDREYSKSTQAPSGAGSAAHTCSAVLPFRASGVPRRR